MLPSAHILPAIAVAIKTKPMHTWIWLPFLVIVLHSPFDLIPHLEPGLIWDDNYTSPHSFGFWWAGFDIFASSWIAYRVWCLVPGHGRTIFLCVCAGLLPDLVQAWGQFRFLPKFSWLPAYIHFHDGLHVWWKQGWPAMASITVGTATTLALWYFSIKCIHEECGK